MVGGEKRLLGNRRFVLGLIGAIFLLTFAGSVTNASAVRCPAWLNDRDLFEGEAIRARPLNQVASDLESQGISRESANRLRNSLSGGSDLAQSRELARQNATNQDAIRSADQERMRLLAPYEAETRTANAHISGADLSAQRWERTMSQALNRGDLNGARVAASQMDYWRQVATDWRRELSNIASRYPGLSDQLNAINARIGSLQDAIRRNQERINQLMRNLRELLGCDDDDSGPSGQCPGGRTVPGLSTAMNAANRSAREIELANLAQVNENRAANGDAPLTLEEYDRMLDRYAERETVPRIVREASNPFLPAAVAGAALIGTGAAPAGAGLGLGAGAGFSLTDFLTGLTTAAAGAILGTTPSGSGSPERRSDDQSSADGLRATPHCAYGGILRWQNGSGWVQSGTARASSDPGSGGSMRVTNGYLIVGSNCINTRRPLRGSDFTVTGYVQRVEAEQDPAGHDPDFNPATQLVGTDWLAAWSYVNPPRARSSSLAHTAAAPPRPTPPSEDTPAESGTYSMQALAAGFRTQLGDQNHPPATQPTVDFGDFFPEMVRTSPRTTISFTNRGRTIRISQGSRPALEVRLTKTSCR